MEKAYILTVVWKTKMAGGPRIDSFPFSDWKKMEAFAEHYCGHVEASGCYKVEHNRDYTYAKFKQRSESEEVDGWMKADYSVPMDKEKLMLGDAPTLRTAVYTF